MAGRRMVEILRTQDLVELTWARNLLAQAEIPSEIFDFHVSFVESNLIPFQRRLMVDAEREAEARTLLAKGRDELEPLA